MDRVCDKLIKGIKIRKVTSYEKTYQEFMANYDLYNHFAPGSTKR